MLNRIRTIIIIFIITVFICTPFLTFAQEVFEIDANGRPTVATLGNLPNNIWTERGGWTGFKNDLWEGTKKVTSGILLAPLELALTALKTVATILLDWSSSLLIFMMSPRLIEGVFFSETARIGISTGWRVVRDFINLFYLLILLFLAITTILGINKYNDKKLFIGVIISALLVNFSLPITLFVIDISNLAMSFFAEAIQANAGALLADKSGIETLFKAEGNMNLKGGGVLFFEVMAIFIMAIIFFVLAATLVIRMIAFWILIILSPLAFFAWAVPGGAVRGIFNDWFTKLTKYAFYGPVLLFFIFLSIIIMNALTQSFSANSSVGDRAVNGDIIISFLIPYIAAIYLLFYGYEQSQKIAAGAGKSLNKLLDKGETWAKKGVKASVAVGTLGAVPAAQYGAKTAKEYGKVGMAGARERVGDMKGMGWVSKKKGEERKKKFEAKMAGGSARDKYEINEANTMVGDIEKQGGKNKDEINEMMKSKNATERKAGAILMAKGGHIENVADMDKAMGEAGKNKIVRNKLNEEIGKSIQKKAKDGKIKTASDYENSVEMLRNMRNTGVSEEAVEGTVGDMTKEVSKKKRAAVMDYHLKRGQDIINNGGDDQLDEEIGRNVVIKDMVKRQQAHLRANGTLRADEEMTGQMKRNFMRGRFRLNHTAFNDEAFANDVKGRSMNKIINQDVDYMSQKSVQDELKKMRTTNPGEYNRVVLNNASPEVRAELTRQGLYP